MEITTKRAGETVGAVRRRGRRLDTYSLDIGGGLRANVVDGTLVGFGLEPVGIVVAPRHLRLEHGKRALAWAAPIAGTVAAGAAVATSLVIRHRRAA